MATQTKQIYLPQKLQIQNVAGSAGRFLWHVVQMVLVMEAGMMVYHLLLSTVLAGTGYAGLTSAYPLFGYWMMIVSMTLPMIALMRYYHNSNWRTCGEMTFAMLAPLAALTGLVLCYLIPNHTLYSTGEIAMLVAMAAYMLYRRDEHSHGTHEHRDHQRAG